VTDAERRQTFDTAVGEYHRLLEVYPFLGYDVAILPKTSIPERANFVLSWLL
jgi:predicted ATPase